MAETSALEDRDKQFFYVVMENEAIKFAKHSTEDELWRAEDPAAWKLTEHPDAFPAGMTDTENMVTVLAAREEIFKVAVEAMEILGVMEKLKEFVARHHGGVGSLLGLRVAFCRYYFVKGGSSYAQFNRLRGTSEEFGVHTDGCTATVVITLPTRNYTPGKTARDWYR